MATKLNSRKTPVKSTEDEDSKSPSKNLSERARRSSSRSKSYEKNDSTKDDPQVSATKLKRRTTPLKSHEHKDRKTPPKGKRRTLSRSKSRENIDVAKDVTLPNVVVAKLNPKRKTPSKSYDEDPKTPSKPSARNQRKTPVKSNEDDDLKTPSKPKNQRKTPIKRSEDEDTKTSPEELLERARRSLSRSNSSENIDSANVVTPSATRRSTRISAKRSKLETIDDLVDEETSDIKPLDDDGWVYDIPPKNFFNENPDDHVHCHSFKTPKKKDGMVALAYNTPKRISELKSVGTPKTPRTPRTPKVVNTPRTPKTPKSSRKVIEPKTPSNVRAKLQKGVRKRCNEVIEDDYLDFEDSGDDYQPDSESSDSDEDVPVDVETADSSSSEDEPKEVQRIVKPVEKILPRRTTRFSARRQQDFVFESDKYFGHTNRKNATSDNTLDCLKTPRLQHEDMFKLLASHEISHTHQTCIRDLQSHYETFFPKWMFILREGFNILLHGLGSKRNILETLHRRVLSHENVLVVNGYFPSLTVKDILDDIVTGLLEMTCKSKNLHEIVDAIEEEMNQTPDYHIFLIVNNLDGTMLRNDMAQNILSRLAHIPNLHLIASVDHINAPNLWDNIQLSNYNFSWWDVTSFLPYTDETSVAENSMLLKNSGALTIASMKSVLLSLTQNARGIYMIIVDNQLASNKTSNYQGMPFKNLYKKCLEAFLVSSDIVLRTQLTEFCDHNLLKLKRTADGTEQLKIPIDNILLQQFVEQYSNWQLEN